MKIAFLYGPFTLGNHQFDFDHLYDDQRGLTGSEYSYIRIAEEFHKLGHEIVLYTLACKSRPYYHLLVKSFSDISSINNSYDAVISWNEFNCLKLIPTNCLKLVNLQINGFEHCYPGFDSYFDVVTSPSLAHQQRLLSNNHLLFDGSSFILDHSKSDVLTNGCDPFVYDQLSKLGITKVPGRFIWASSPDRGLHWLLQEWPKIKKAIPKAHLKIFYRVKPWLSHFLSLEKKDLSFEDSLVHQRSRAFYIAEALKKLSNHDISLVDSVSRHQINKEMYESQIMAYPCDTVNWTEGFSVSLMEACAAGVIPITSDVDALGSIYGSHIPTIKSPIGNHLEEFTETVIKSITNLEYGNEIIKKAKELSQMYTWEIKAKELEALITKHRERLNK